MVKWFVIGAALAMAATASAGYTWSSSVNVNTAGRSAQGHSGHTYNSADTVEYIYCSVSLSGGGGGSVGCLARNTAGTFGGCSTTSPSATALHAASAVSGDTYVTFGWDVSGACTFITNYNGSQFHPKTPP